MKLKKCSQRFLMYQLFQKTVTLVCHWMRSSKSWYPVCKSLELLCKHRVTLEVGLCLYQLAKDCYQVKSHINKSAKQSSISGVNQSLIWLYFRLLSTRCSPYRPFRESKLNRLKTKTAQTFHFSLYAIHSLTKVLTISPTAGKTKNIFPLFSKNLYKSKGRRENVLHKRETSISISQRSQDSIKDTYQIVLEVRSVDYCEFHKKKALTFRNRLHLLLSFQHQPMSILSKMHLAVEGCGMQGHCVSRPGAWNVTILQGFHSRLQQIQHLKVWY